MPRPKLLRPTVDLSEQRFGDWTVVQFLERKEYRTFSRFMWQVRCICGRLSVKSTTELQAIKSGSRGEGCGCKKGERISINHGSRDPNAARNWVMRGAKNGAKSRNLPWELTNEQFDSLISGSCHYCGAKPFKNKIRLETKYPENAKGIVCNGVDRKDSNKGYCVENCVPCCSTCNYAKRDMKYIDFIAWIDRLKQYSPATAAA